ncbi:fluoride efflux transporter FluC [Anaerobacillus sp. MEB173]|uniref:fluoride efflux transporter FluC n=1 Tax=Anaerobacillus sp. MEB173 TaxID=3383345 RepID=UPI003F8F105C
MSLLKNIIAVGLGGALGSLFRYWINLNTVHTQFPFGTLLENLIGSLLLGILTGWLVNRQMKEWIKSGIGVGLCGGFTTMSTLAADTMMLYGTSSPFLFVTYIAISMFGGVFFALIGYISIVKWHEKKDKHERWTTNNE